MKHRTGINSIIHLLWCIFLLPLLVYSQDPKPPVAEDDYVNTFVATPVTVNVLANDYTNEGDTIVLYAITSVSNGQAWFEDSLVHYTPSNNNALVSQAKVYYVVKDLTTGLYSAEGTLYITFDRVASRVFEPNGIGARINAIGNQFMKLDTFCFECPNHHFEVPVHSGKNSIYNSSLWVAGLDGNGKLHTACERYRKGKYPYMSSRGWDYWSGPVLDTVQYTDEYLTDHNRIWYITREEIRYHNNHYQQPNYILPDRIKDWPANGYPDLGSAEVLAPFADKNNNGFYDPENGDYPLIRGDEAVYFIFNDDFGPHTESFGRKLGLEGHGLAYGFNCSEDSAFFNTLFIRYEVINRSDTAYHDVYLGNYTNLVVGSFDDYLACDTTLNAFYAYNMDDFDDTLSLYYPGYMEHPPAQAVVWLNRPMERFIYFHYPWPNSDTMFNLAPTTPERYYNYMQGLWNDSTHLTYGGDGHLGSLEVDHAFTGDPLTETGWLEKNSGLDNSILQGLSSCGPLDFGPGDTLELELAYVFARDYEGDHLSAVSLLKNRVERIRWFYDNDSTPCGTAWTGTISLETEGPQALVVPNPATNSIVLHGLLESFEYEILSLEGTVVKKGRSDSGKKIDVSRLPPGFYVIRVKYIREGFIKSFVKL